jgi:hypothetical protein
VIDDSDNRVHIHRFRHLHDESQRVRRVRDEISIRQLRDENLGP